MAPFMSIKVSFFVICVSLDPEIEFPISVYKPIENVIFYPITKSNHEHQRHYQG
jgi:hypothetical protein